MSDVNKNIDNCNPNQKCRIMIVCNDMIADMISNKKRNPITTELFIRCRKLSFFLVFITQAHIAVPKDFRLNSANSSIIKIPKKKELQ